MRILFQDIRKILILFSLQILVHTWRDYGMTIRLDMQNTKNIGYMNFIKELSQGICWRRRKKTTTGLLFTHKKKPSSQRAERAASTSF